MKIEDRLEEIQEKCQGKSGQELDEARKVAAKHIKAIRAELGLGVPEFARMISVPSITVKRWESAEYSPNSMTTRKLKRALVGETNNVVVIPDSGFRIEIGVVVDNLDDALDLLSKVHALVKNHSGSPNVFRAQLR